MGYNLLKLIENVHMEPKKKKTSADYPQFQFRLSQNDKEEIQNRIDKLYETFNKGLNEQYKNFKKGEIVLEALKRGISSLEKENK